MSHLKLYIDEPRELTDEDRRKRLRRFGERFTSLIDHKAPVVLLINDIALACKHLAKLNPISDELGPFPGRNEINEALMAVYLLRWKRQSEETEPSK